MVDTRKKGHREKLRERFLGGDKSAQTEEAVLELLLTYAIPRKDIKPLAKGLIEEFGSLSKILAADFETLCNSKGIGSNSATLIKLVDWIKSYGYVKVSEQALSQLPDPAQTSLFDLSGYSEKPPESKKEEKKTIQRKVLPRRGTGLFGMAILKEAIDLLPTLPDTDSLNEVKNHLMKSLHQSSEQTRSRNSNYIIRRMFTNGVADQAIRHFAKHFQDTRDLREVCFYRFIKAEPLIAQVIDELLIPSIGRGSLNRSIIKDYLAKKFPSSRSIRRCSQAIIDALKAGGIANIERVKITFRYRDIILPAFAFVLHSEFPEPGMYDITKLESNPTIRAMLWNPDSILDSLYELRNQGIISKISEIDNIRQFTVKRTLDQVVKHLIAGGRRP